MMKTLQQELAGTFNLEFQVKSFIAGYYTRDCEDWLWMYKTIERADCGKMSIQSKSFTMLRFAMECGLKAMLVALSKQPETAEKAYKVVKITHNLERLLVECKNRSCGRFKIVSTAYAADFAKINRLSVGIRYDLDFKTEYKSQSLTEKFNGDGPISGVVLNQAFREDMHQEAIQIHKRALKIQKSILGKHCAMMMSNLDVVEDYMRRIRA